MIMACGGCGRYTNMSYPNTSTIVPRPTSYMTQTVDVDKPRKPVKSLWDRIQSRLQGEKTDDGVSK